MVRIATHLYHDSTIAMDLDGEYRNIELERVYGKRHYDWRQEREGVDELLELARREHGKFDEAVVVGSGDERAAELFRMLGVASVSRVDHHLAHAAASFYQSPFDRALLVSYDGGGNDGTFRTFLGSREAGITPLDAD